MSYEVHCIRPFSQPHLVFEAETLAEALIKFAGELGESAPAGYRVELHDDGAVIFAARSSGTLLKGRL